MLSTPISPAVFYLQTTPLEERILLSLQQHPGSNSSEIATMSKSTTVATSKGLNELFRAGYLNRTREGKNIHYTIEPTTIVPDILSLMT